MAHDTIHMFASSPSFADDGCCFAARDSGLYRSADGGRTWHSAYTQLRLDEPLPTASVLVSPTFASDRRVYAGVNGGILSSTDGGATWQPAAIPTPTLTTCFAISPDFAVDGTIFAGTLEHGILRSGDRGGRWEAWNFGLLDRSVLALAISPGYVRDQMVFAGTASGLYRSTNGGRAWREVEGPHESETILSLAISPTYLEDGIILAGTESAGLFASTDHAKTWPQVGANLGRAAINAILLGHNPLGEHIALLLHDSALRVLVSNGAGWHPLEVSELVGCQATAVAAPASLAPDALLLIGSVEGRVERIAMEITQSSSIVWRLPVTEPWCS